MDGVKKINDSLLIIGGNGFIGNWAIKKAVQVGYRVTSLSRTQANKSEKIKNVEYLTADISVFKEVLNALKNKKFTHVINLSGEINHSPLENGGREVIENHFIGLMNLVCSLNRDFLKCFIQVGSSDEYGDLKAPQNEHLNCSPLSPYSFAKHSCNNLLQMLHKTEKFPVIIVRLFLVFGPKQNFNRFMPQVISSCLQDKTFPVSQGDQLRDFCYVEDVIEGIFLALESEGLYGNIFNLASGNPIKIRNLVDRLVNIIGRGKPIFGALPYRLNENMNLYADVSKAKKYLNWKSQTDFDESLKKTIEYYQSNCQS